MTIARGRFRGCLTQSRYGIANSGEKAFLGVGTHDLDTSLEGGNTDQKQIDQRTTRAARAPVGIWRLAAPGDGPRPATQYLNAP